MEAVWNGYIYWPRFIKRRIVTLLKYSVPRSMRFIPPVLHPYFVPATQFCYSGSGENLKRAYFTYWISQHGVFT